MIRFMQEQELEEAVCIVNPNLGHPRFLKIDSDLKQREWETYFLAVSNFSNPKQVEDLLTHNMNLVPVLEYKWKLKRLLERKKKERERKKKKRKSFWDRLKFWKSDSDQKEEKQKKGIKFKSAHDFEQKLNKLKPRAFRGDPIVAYTLRVEPVKTINIKNIKYLENQYTSPQEYLRKHDAFRMLNYFYKVKVSFSLSEEVLEFLKRRDFVMFDIIVRGKKGIQRVNYHALVISKKQWENFTFAHATDLHLAERNDRIFGIIKKWKDVLQKSNKIKKTKQERKEILKDSESRFKLTFPEKLKFWKKSKNKPSSDSSDKIEAKKESEPLEDRLVNPNNQFRKFIELMNEKVLKNELDFVTITGDIVDFTLLSKLPKDLREMIDFEYEHSNWKVFKKILLNQQQKQRPGMIEGEEILCPIFTVPGNHDYRPFHYDIRWAGMYKKIGLKLEEALALNDKLLAIPINSITKSKRALRAYLAEINPSLDFSLVLGENILIFLDSGSDSWKNFRDLVSGHPSVTGLRARQIGFLENLINHKNVANKKNVFLFVHGPPINPKKKRGLLKRIKNSFSKKIRIKIDEFKESILKRLGKTLNIARIDGKFNVKFGTISSNWEKLIEFCKDYTTLTLAGHTHELKEFRLAEPKEEKSRVYDAPPFSLKKVENPAAVYYDLYSKMYNNDPGDIERFSPFVLQTPALGLGSYHEPELRGAYRIIEVKDGKLNSFSVNFLD
ncbi:MAG: metallophosphoesterase [Promethearchaeia archaeon]